MAGSLPFNEQPKRQLSPKGTNMRVRFTSRSYILFAFEADDSFLSSSLNNFKQKGLPFRM